MVGWGLAGDRGIRETILAGDGYVASEEREVLDKPSGKAERSTAVDMTNTLQSSRLSIPPAVISTKRSAWRDLSMANNISNQWDLYFGEL